MTSPFDTLVTPLSLPPSRERTAPTPIAQVQQVLDKENGEEWIWGQEDVGLYQGYNKMPSHQVLSVQLTTHRLLFILPPPPTYLPSSSSSSAPATSLQVSLASVRQTELYAGFMRSSAKISLFMAPASSSSSIAAPAPSTSSPSSSTSKPISTPPVVASPASEGETWTCHVCTMSNTSPTVCSLCGISKSTSLSLPVSRSSTPLAQPRGKPAGSGSSLGPSGLGTVTGPASEPPSRPDSPVLPPGATPKPATTDTFSTGSTDSTSATTTPADTEVACPRCTFLNHPSLPNCEICGSPLPTSASRPATSSIYHGTAGSSSSASRAQQQKQSQELQLLKISFRKGGVNEMYKRLKAVLSQKNWEGRSAGAGGIVRRGKVVGGATDEAALGESLTPTRKTMGIDRILQNMDLESKSKEEDVQDAFKDLEALMVRAGEMVRLVQSLNAKLEQSTSSNPSGTQDTPESTFIRSSLVQLGLPVPALTQDMVKSEYAYHLGLAKELGAFLTGGVDEKGKRMEGVMVGSESKGLVGLDEVWGLWNRARGISLVPPKTLSAVLPFLATHSRPPISVMTFQSGLSVLHTPFYSSAAFNNRLLRRLQPEMDEVEADASVEKGLSAVDIALQEGVAVGLAKELVEKIERDYGSIVRDEQSADGGGERWQRNLISSWTWQEVN